jgi:hypothetical protein
MFILHVHAYTSIHQIPCTFDTEDMFQEARFKGLKGLCEVRAAADVAVRLLDNVLPSFCSFQATDASREQSREPDSSDEMAS